MLQLQRAATDPAMRRLGDKHSRFVHRFRRPGDTPTVSRDTARRDRRLRPRATVEQAALDEEQVDTSLQDRTLGTASSQRA